METEAQGRLTTSLNENLVMIQELMHGQSDLVFRKIRICGCPIALLSCEGMVDEQKLAEMVFRPLMELHLHGKNKPQELYTVLEEGSLLGIDMGDAYTTDEVFLRIMSGFLVILIDGIDRGVAFGVQGFSARSVEEPSGESNVRGSREGFNEVIRNNMSLIRRRLKTPDLVFDLFQIGKQSHTDVCLVFRSDMAEAGLVEQVRRRLEDVPLDSVLESGYLQPYLQGSPLSLFTDVGITERPDTLCAKINEGRVAVLVDNTPFALIVPYLFTENFQTVDDYCQRPYYSSFMRIIKYCAFFFTIFLPGVYVAVATYHPELFPQALLFNIAASETVVPFPLMLEALMIHFVYEIMREAGLRLPQPVGHAVSIVGSLVIGDAAVTAGLIGPPMVIVVAVTAISSFVVPSIYEPVAVLRFAFIIIGGLLGLYGIAVGALCLLFNITALHSYGVPYTSPVTPFSGKAMRDTFVRLGWAGQMKDTVKIQTLRGVHMRDGLTRKKK